MKFEVEFSTQFLCSIGNCLTVLAVLELFCCRLESGCLAFTILATLLPADYSGLRAIGFPNSPPRYAYKVIIPDKKNKIYNHKLP